MNYEDKIKQAELDKLIADIEKSKVETKKISKEREQFEKPFYKRLSFVKTIMTGIIGGIAIVSVFRSVIEPTYKKDIIKSELEIAIKEKKNFELNDSIQLVKKDIIKQKKRTIEIIDNQLQHLRSLNKENSILVQSIYFDHNKADLSQDQEKQLSTILKLLSENNNSNFKIEINGYAYSKGTEEDNEKLSKKRISTVQGYLIANGLSSSRMSVIGVGESNKDQLKIEKLDIEIEKKLYELKSVVQIYLTY